MTVKETLNEQNKYYKKQMEDSAKKAGRMQNWRRFGSMVIGIMGMTTLFTMPGFGIAAISAAMAMHHGTTNKVNKTNCENVRLGAEIDNNNKIIANGISNSAEANATRKRKLAAAKKKLDQKEQELKSNKTKIGLTNALTVAGLAAGAVFGSVPVVGLAIGAVSVGAACLKHALSIDNKNYEKNYQNALAEYNNVDTEVEIVKSVSSGRKGKAAGKGAEDDLAMSYRKEKEDGRSITVEKEEIIDEPVAKTEPKADTKVNNEVKETTPAKAKTKESPVKEESYNYDLVEAYLNSLSEEASYETAKRSSK